MHIQAFVPDTPLLYEVVWIFYCWGFVIFLNESFRIEGPSRGKGLL